MIYYQNPPKFNVIYATRTARVGSERQPKRNLTHASHRFAILFLITMYTKHTLVQVV